SSAIFQLSDQYKNFFGVTLPCPQPYRHPLRIPIEHGYRRAAGMRASYISITISEKTSPMTGPSRARMTITTKGATHTSTTPMIRMMAHVGRPRLELGAAGSPVGSAK